MSNATLRFLVFAAVLFSVDSALAQDRNPALNASDRFAWELFAKVNRPAGNGSNDAFWETWANQDDVYKDPNTAPVFPQNAHQPKVLKPSVQQQMLIQQRLLEHSNQVQMLMKEMGVAHPIQPQFIPSNPTEEEVRMNKSTFDFIVMNNLWYLQGQVAAFNKGAAISFPIDSIEVKAHWRAITESEKAKYHWQTGSDGKLYGLYALHIMTKDIPNWFWATFEQVDNPERCKVLGCTDSFGLTSSGDVSAELKQLFKQAGMGSEWQYYRLDGAQTNFTDSTGRPTLLGNSIIERGFVQTSSCMTCHARAGIDATGNRLDIFLPNNQSYNGTPDPAWYFQAAGSRQTQKYLQLDFVWSLFLAQPRTQ